MRLIWYILWIILILLGVSFSLLNSYHTTVNYFIGKIDIYFPLLFLLMLFVGTLLGVCALIPFCIRLKTHIHQLKQQIKNLEQNLEQKNERV